MTKNKYKFINVQVIEENDDSISYGRDELAEFFPNMPRDTSPSYSKSKELNQTKKTSIDDLNIDKNRPTVQDIVVTSRPEIEAALKNIGVYVPEKLEELAGMVERALSEQPLLPEPHKSLKPLFEDRNKVDENGNPIRPDLYGKNIVEWLKIVWGEEMKAELLSRAELRSIDMSAERAIQNYLRDGPLPDDIRLLSKSEKTARQTIAADEVRAARRLLGTVRRMANQRRP
jgi:hypothetical protein